MRPYLFTAWPMQPAISTRYFGEDHGFGYYTKVKFREISVQVKLLSFWKWLGFEFLVNRFPRYRDSWSAAR